MTNETAITRGDLRQVIGQIAGRVHQEQRPVDSVNVLQKSFIKERRGTSMTNEDNMETLFHCLYIDIFSVLSV